MKCVVEIPSLWLAIQYCFASYFVMNITYPKEANPLLLFLETQVFGLKASAKIPVIVTVLIDNLLKCWHYYMTLLLLTLILCICMCILSIDSTKWCGIVVVFDVLMHACYGVLILYTMLGGLLIIWGVSRVFIEHPCFSLSVSMVFIRHPCLSLGCPKGVYTTPFLVIGVSQGCLYDTLSCHWGVSRVYLQHFRLQNEGCQLTLWHPNGCHWCTKLWHPILVSVQHPYFYSVVDLFKVHLFNPYWL